MAIQDKDSGTTQPDTPNPSPRDRSVQLTKEIRLKLGVDQLPAAILVAEEETICHANPAAEALLSKSRKQLNGTPWRELIHPDHRQSADKLLQGGSAPANDVCTPDVRLNTPPEPPAWVRLRMKAFTIADHDLRIISLTDITSLKSAGENLFLAAKAFETSSEGMLITDREVHILEVNDAFCKITGYSREEVIGKTPDFMQPDETGQEIYDQIRDTLRETDEWEGEIWNRRKNGAIYPKWLTIKAIRSADGQITHYIGNFVDISEKKLVEQRLERLMHFDLLTGLPNRILLRDRMQQAIRQTARSKGQAAVLSLGLDRFKNINDTFGHEAGDRILKDVGQLLTGCLREVDTIGRSTGDEYIILLTNVNHKSVASVAQRVLDAFARPFNIDGHEIFLTCSIGIAMFPFDGHNGEMLLKNADSAMYHAKESGKNTYQFYSADMNIWALERLELESSLRRALEREELLLHYQPRIDLHTGRMVGMEALIRWQHPQLGLVSPGKFIPLAEETGLIVPIGEWVLRTACHQNKAWQDEGLPPITVSINMSARQFRHHNPAESVARALRQSTLPPQFLEVELTESIIMHEETDSIKKLNDLTAMGIHLSIDDFGTGYSSLSYLKRFPISTLKIDRSFVRDLPDDSDSAAIAATIIAIARSLNLIVVAEGVETKDQLSFLTERECDQIQGFLFSRPLPREEFRELLRRNPEFVPPAGSQSSQ